MYSYEDRLRAAQLYIRLGKRVGLTTSYWMNSIGNWNGAATVLPVTPTTATSWSKAKQRANG